MDLNHNHPVMKAFIILLKEEANIGHKYRPITEEKDGVDAVENGE